MFLLVFSPLAFGGVYPWASAVIEALAALLVVAWLGKLRVRRAALPRPWGKPWRGVLLPPLLLLLLGLAQLVPLPLAMERYLSPATVTLYQRSLAGWPVAGLGLPPRAIAESAGAPLILPTPQEVAAGAPVPFAPGANAVPASLAPAAVQAAPPTWMPLSIAPSVSEPWVLKLAAYVGLFLTVLTYPIGAPNGPERVRAERRFHRLILQTALVMGLLVATLGIIEQVTWNGRMLWTVVPYDWGAAQQFRASRAMGPFVNPDHFANYLSLIFPIALAGALFRTFLRAHDARFPWALFSALAAFVIVCAILLSLSRAGWISAFVGVLVLAAFSPAVPEELRPRFLRAPSRRRLSLALALFLALVAGGAAYLGPNAQAMLNGRLDETLSGYKFMERVHLWDDSLGMVQDFPAFGVGFGAWPELFPQYRRPPYSGGYFREAHNDYVELATEAGLAGLALVAWFAIAAAARLGRGVASVPPDIRALYLALLAALAAMGFHESVDFPLHTPANAVLFVVLLATALRLSGLALAGAAAARPPRATDGLAATAILAAALALIVAALRQDPVPYPYNIPRPANPSEARALILAHPADASAHLAAVDLAGPNLPVSLARAQLAVAAWLDPTNPAIRDRYAQALARDGNPAAALREITLSVRNSPSLGTHGYLDPRLLPWLSPAETGAVTKGFEEAVTRNLPGAVEGFGSFEQAMNRPADAAALYAHAARGAPTPERQADFLLLAGEAYAAAGAASAAIDSFNTAAALISNDARPYVDLVSLVYGPRERWSDAGAAVATGIRHGADRATLYLALANARQWCPNAQEWGANLAAAEAALEQAIAARPTDAGLLMRLGDAYSQQRRFTEAAQTFARASQLAPNSADALYLLAGAEEANYDFTAATRNYQRALALAPDRTDWSAHYQQFLREIALGSPRVPAGQ